MKLLLVDDDLAALMVTSMALEETGRVKVIQAQQGKEALDLAITEQPDAVLMDVILPDMSGTEVLRRLRSDPATQHIPVILHTAKNSPSEIRVLVASGALGVICKPFNPLRIYAEIERILGLSSSSVPRKKKGQASN